LHKQLAQATNAGDKTKAEAIEREIEERGGLKVYQDASITGQSQDRGGDSSKVLMQWMVNHKPADKSVRLKMLEVGALSTTNACARSDLFDMTWIDLNSQDPKITQQDFMQRPLPKTDLERFNVISLSLVVNYVPDAIERGKMLRRTRDFLRTQDDNAPLLFFVLPAPCVTNSRYMDEKRLNQIMTSLGFGLAEQKLSPKLYYSLWTFNGAKDSHGPAFPKVEINPGRTRNNFCIILP
jgi:25S rRNA (adenine2142-N1)-methyltransferase